MVSEGGGGDGGGVGSTLNPLSSGDLAGSRVKSPGLLEDWWQGYPVWQGDRDAAVPMVIVVIIAATLGLIGNLLVAGILSCSARRPHTPTTFYLLHRAVADACVQVCQPLMLLTLVADLNPWACIFNSALMQMGMVASTVFLSGFALDSFLGSKPRHFKSKTRWKVLRAVVMVAWVAALLLFTLTGLGIFRRGDMCLEAPLFLIHTHDGLFVCLLLVFTLPLVVLVASLILMLTRKEVTRNDAAPRPRTGTVTAATEVRDGDATPTGSPPRLLVALSGVFAVTHCPYWALRIHYSRVWELLPFSVHAAVISLLVIGTALDPLLGVWFRVELWQGVVARLPSHPSTVVPLRTV